MPGSPVVKAIFRDWMVSGVTKYLSGAATQPACTSTTTGVANQNPTLTPGATAACVYTGEPLFVERDSNLPEEDQLHFNPRAFAMATPLSATVGNFGNTPMGQLRNPSWSNWDLTLARRFQVPAMGKKAGLRLQFQAYNVFNQVEFTTMSSNLSFTTGGVLSGTSTPGRYTAVNPARQFGITARFDF